MDSEKEALINAVEMAIDWCLDVSEDDIKLYHSYIEERKKNMGKNVTEKYQNMIEAFSADFQIAIDDTSKLEDLANQIEHKAKRLMQDIDLLDELEYGIRYGKLIIIEKE